MMMDFGRAYPERSLAELVTNKFRPGDIYTHCYAGGGTSRTDDGKVKPAISTAESAA